MGAMGASKMKRPASWCPVPSCISLTLEHRTMKEEEHLQMDGCNRMDVRGDLQQCPPLVPIGPR